MSSNSMALRIVKAVDRKEIVWSGKNGGKASPLRMDIVKNLDNIKKDGGMFMPLSDISATSKHGEMATPNSLLYSFRKDGVILGYRRCEIDGEKGFWIYENTEK